MTRDRIAFRLEGPKDRDAIFAVHAAAFETDAEARLVDRLRAEADPYFGWVATLDHQVIAHVAFSPVTAVREDGTSTVALGLAPMAVLPARQYQGIGGRLIRAGHAALADMGHDTIFVLGHADYYPRFGFTRADAEGWTFAPGTEHAFFVRGPVPPGPGIVRYHPAFEAV